MSTSVLIVEDDEAFRDVLTDHLRLRKFDVSTASRVSVARQLALRSHPHVLLLDQKLPDGDGVALAQELLSVGMQTKIILITAHADLARAIAATRAGVFDYLQKPAELSTLEDTIRRAARAARAQSTVSPAVGTTGRDSQAVLIGVSPATQRLRAQLEAAARACPAPVLITGETGVGKGLAARMVHATGPRARGPLVIVNCAAIPESMFEAELFGHERGAFTGAHHARPGLFESAHGGTLVLDEIAEASPVMQTKLLRALEEGVVRRVGAQAERIIDVRVIATTNRDVEELVRTSEFRKDLYYRIAVVRIEAPPLRERREDIPLLAESFLAGFRLSPAVLLCDEELAALHAHHWPGNVRELRNVLQRWSIAQQSHRQVSMAELVYPTRQLGSGAAREGDGDDADPGTEGSSSLPQASERTRVAPGPTSNDSFLSLAELEGRHVRAALLRANHNRTHAAKLLGISRATLRRKLKGEDEHGKSS